MRVNNFCVFTFSPHFCQGKTPINFKIVTVYRFENVLDRVRARGALGGGELGSERLNLRTDIARRAAHYSHSMPERDLCITKGHPSAPP